MVLTERTRICFLRSHVNANSNPILGFSLFEKKNKIFIASIYLNVKILSTSQLEMGVAGGGNWLVMCLK